MAVLIVGSIALDSVKTPFGEAEEVLGGSATYASYAASFFTTPYLVGVVGKDFPEKHIELLRGKSIDLKGLMVEEGKTFRWKGYYDFDLNSAKTLSTCLNVFQNFRPRLPEEYRKIKNVFLGNIDPDVQLEVIDQVESPELVVGDTMNFWISNKKEALLKVLKKINVLVINDAEARQLSEEPNLIKAGKNLLSFGPEYIIIKKGEHGALLFSDSVFFSLPAYPLESLYDPTGAGDSFAGGFIGYLSGIDNFNGSEFKKALVYGSVVASFDVEDFSLNRLVKLNKEDIDRRYKEFVNISHFENFKRD